jgi:hypothetical protein
MADCSVWNRNGATLLSPLFVSRIFIVSCPLSTLYCPSLNSLIPLSLGIKPVLAAMVQVQSNLPSFDLVVIFPSRTPPHFSYSFFDTPAALLYTFTIY